MGGRFAAREKTARPPIGAADNIRWRALLATLASAHPADEADNPLRGLQLIRRPVELSASRRVHLAPQDVL